MTIRNKLATSSTALFALTVGIVLLGTFIIFKHRTHDLYYSRLQERAYTVAYFYFERDEVSQKHFKEIEAKFLRIHSESVRVYKAPHQSQMVYDSIPESVSSRYLSQIMMAGNKTFDIGDRQFAGLFYKDNEGDFIIVVSGKDLTGHLQVRALRNLLLMFFFISIPVQFLLSAYLAKRTFRPVSSIIKKVNSITTENLHSRLDADLNTKDEMQELAATFNYFLERLENGVKIQNNFVKNASHELRTPLTIIIGDIEVALNYSKSPAEYETLLHTLKKDALHLKSILEGLLTLSDLEISQKREMKLVNMDEIIWEALEKKTLEYPGAKVSINFEHVMNRDKFIVKGNWELLFIAVSNLLDNAIKFSSLGEVNIEAAVDNDQLTISISDNGVGISRLELASVFELFYRTNKTRSVKGQGLGLYITKQILEIHSADLKIDSEEQVGTKVTVTFPGLDMS